jgi:hypothetical protein
MGNEVQAFTLLSENLCSITHCLVKFQRPNFKLQLLELKSDVRTSKIHLSSDSQLLNKSKILLAILFGDVLQKLLALAYGLQ